MARNDILQMEPSLEMDRLVAERVMGWEERTDPAHWVEVESGTEKPTGWFINGETNRKPVWAPSTDVKAAIRVMEELRRRGYDVSIEKKGLTWTIELQGEDYYSVASSEGSTRMIQLHHHQGPRYVALGKSFQEAICRVALLAVMDANEG